MRDQHEDIVAYRTEWARPRYAAVAAALTQFRPGWSWTAPAGGHVVWVRGEEPDSGAYAQAALRRGVAVVPGHLLSVSADRSPWIRLAFSLPPADLSVAIKALASA